MHYINILNKIYDNSNVKDGKLIINEFEFHKLAEDINSVILKDKTLQQQHNKYQKLNLSY